MKGQESRHRRVEEERQESRHRKEEEEQKGAVV